MSSMTENINRFYDENCHSEVLKYKSTIAHYGIIAKSLSSVKSFVAEFSANERPLFLREGISSGKCSYNNFIEHYPSLKTTISHPKFSKMLNEIIFREAPEVINVEKVYEVKMAYEVVLETQKHSSYPLQIPSLPSFNSALDHFNFNLNPFNHQFEEDYPKGSINVDSYIAEIREQLVDSQSSSTIKHDEV